MAANVNSIVFGGAKQVGPARRRATAFLASFERFWSQRNTVEG